MTRASRRTSALLTAGAVAAAAVGVGAVAWAASRGRATDGRIVGAVISAPDEERTTASADRLTMQSMQAILGAPVVDTGREGDRPSSAPRTGQREAALVDCAVTVGGLTSRRRVTAEECEELRAAASVASSRDDGRRCNRTPARACREDPTWCARNSAQLAVAGIATAGSGGIGWPSLIVPAATWTGKIASLPCESEGEEA
jgi:hypothetical protein